MKTSPFSAKDEARAPNGAESAHHFAGVDRRERMGVPELIVTRDRAGFLEFVADIRPELHRYCARMTGSVVDGEDVLQETLLKAFTALPQLAEVEQLKAWVFRLAHNQAIDRWRSYEQRMRTPLEAVRNQPDETDRGAPADEALAREQALRTALSRFLELPPLQRSSVILKDVLDHSLDEIAGMLTTTVPAVQAALYRARSRLAALHRAAPEPALPVLPVSPTLIRYATLFNHQDWDALRSLLAEDVRLDVVERFSKRGRGEVGSYFGNYARMAHWRVAPGWLEGREVLAVSRLGHARWTYFIVVGVEAGQVVSIRDFHHLPYVADEARIALAPAREG